MVANADTSPPPAPSAAPPRGRSRMPRRRHIKWIVGAIVLIVAVVAGLRYWRQSELFVTTDNAYVGANQAEIAAQVSGPVTQVYVRDQQHVKAGDPLFEIDRGPYEIALARAQAQLELARQQMQQQGAGVASAEALLAQRRSEAANARSNWVRNQELMKSGFLSPQGG